MPPLLRPGATPPTRAARLGPPSVLGSRRCCWFFGYTLEEDGAVFAVRGRCLLSFGLLLYALVWSKKPIDQRLPNVDRPGFPGGWSSSPKAAERVLVSCVTPEMSAESRRAVVKALDVDATEGVVQMPLTTKVVIRNYQSRSVPVLLGRQIRSTFFRDIVLSFKVTKADQWIFLAKDFCDRLFWDIIAHSVSILSLIYLCALFMLHLLYKLLSATQYSWKHLNVVLGMKLVNHLLLQRLRCKYHPIYNRNEINYCDWITKPINMSNTVLTRNFQCAVSSVSKTDDTWSLAKTQFTI